MGGGNGDIGILPLILINYYIHIILPLKCSKARLLNIFSKWNLSNLSVPVWLKHQVNMQTHL